jgi:H+-transporting ATPase
MRRRRKVSRDEARAGLMEEYQGEEYEVLLRYVKEQQEKLKNKGNDNGEDEDKDAKYIRKWYMPWKKVKVDSGKRKVPQEWLDTDRQKGISVGEAEERRKVVGYNELERQVCLR